MSPTLIIFTILYILTTHFVADFVKQTYEMASYKSTSIKWLTLHILAYYKWFIFSGIMYYAFAWILAFNFSVWPLIWYCTLNAGLHWITDYFTSKATSTLWKQKRVHDFFVMIGFDQLIHMFCLIGTYWIIFL